MMMMMMMMMINQSIVVEEEPRKSVKKDFESYQREREWCVVVLFPLLREILFWLVCRS